MTKEQLNEIFQKAHQELASELTLEKLNESVKQSLKDIDNPTENDVTAIVSMEIFYLNQKFLFKVLEKILVDKA